jgi:hypothetical protein
MWMIGLVKRVGMAEPAVPRARSRPGGLAEIEPGGLAEIEPGGLAEIEPGGLAEIEPSMNGSPRTPGSFGLDKSGAAAET